MRRYIRRLKFLVTEVWHYSLDWLPIILLSAVAVAALVFQATLP